MKISRAVLGACAAIAFAGCLADTSETAEERVGQSDEALSSPDGPPPLELPIWHVYLAGRDNQGHSYPDEIDLDGHVVAVREADGDGPRKVVHLYLQNHWMMGDKWIDDLIAAGKLTSLDVIVITSEILRSHGALQPLPRGIMAVNDGGDWNPFPGLPGSSEPYGGPTAGSSHPNRGDNAPRGGGSGGVNGGSRGRGGSSAPIGRRDPHDEAYRNGVRRGDSYAGGGPYPTSYPGVPGYTARGEKASLFKCEGTAYYGDKSACPDFAGGSIGRRWGDKLSRWEVKYLDPNNKNIAATDWEGICKSLVYALNFFGCTSVGISCIGLDMVTIGGLTLPCAAWALLICGGHSAAGAKLGDRCPEIAKR